MEKYNTFLKTTTRYCYLEHREWHLEHVLPPGYGQEPITGTRRKTENIDTDISWLVEVGCFCFLSEINSKVIILE